MKRLWLATALASAVCVPAHAQTIDPRIEKLVASISEEHLQQLLQKLSTFRTRNTCSDPNAPDGIGPARQWIFDEMKRASPKLQVSFDAHTVQKVRDCTGSVDVRNVMAVLPGRTARRISVSGHYDSLNLSAAGQQASNAGPASPQRPGAEAGTPQTRPGAAPQAPGEQPSPSQPPSPRRVPNPNAVAPGANDDGSGTVLSMELARAFAASGIEFDATLVFMAVDGGEQGPVRAPADAEEARGEKIPIPAWGNNHNRGGAPGGRGP